MNTTIRVVDARKGHRGTRRPVVFIVDDDVATLGLLCEVALEAGWDARGFGRLDGLREAVSEEPPSLLILDDELPDGRGGDLARELAGDSSLAGVPIIVCTGAHPMRRAEIGAWAPVISKPFDLGEIERLLDVARDHAGGYARGHRAG